MESKSRQFQLALSYDNYTRVKSLKAALKPLPYHIREEEDSQGHMPDLKPQNIFSEPSEARTSMIDPKTCQPYQYVGMKEMKSYISKIDKKKRHQNTVLKRSTQTSLSMLSLTRVSHTKVPQQRYLTKEEVMDKFIKSSQKSTENSFIEETYLNNDHSFMRNISPNTTLTTSFPQFMTSPQEKEISRDFSLKKVLTRMKKYQHSWEHQTAAKKVRGLQKRNATIKVTSLLQQAQQFRSKMQQQQRYTIFQQIQNIQPKLWDRVLRTSKTMVNLCEKDIEHVVKAGFTVSGKNKFEKEVEWLQNKDRQGLFFRFQKDQKESLK